MPCFFFNEINKNFTVIKKKCIKSNDQKVLLKDNDIKERWREYFGIFLNEDYIGDIRTKEDTSLAKLTAFFFFL